MQSRRRETVRAESLSTGYSRRNGRTVTVTSGIDGSLYSGELTCLLGPNGAGKSTLLKTLTAFQPPVAGRVTVEGVALDDYSAGRLAKTIGVVLTEKPQVNAMTVEELVALGRSPYTGFWGRLGDDDTRAVDEAMAVVGIEALRHRALPTLSDGERQKAMIAKALAQQAPILVLDEPAAFLDYPGKVAVMQLLRQMARDRGMTVFMSTHDLELALQTADRVWIIDKKHGVTTGTPEDCALRGDIGRYFSGEGVEFDIRSGLFLIDNPGHHAVRVAGDEPAVSMLKRALARHGITSSGDDGRDGTVEARSEGFFVNGKPCADIGAVLDAVDAIFER